MRERFWERPLSQLDAEEWEALCDGCGLCCLVKLEDEDSGDVAYTSVACRYMEPHECSCTVYPERHRKVPDCVKVTRELAAEASWLPPTCAYRLRAREQPLPAWHPLLSGRAASVHEAGVGVSGWTLSEAGVDEDDLEEHIIHWIDGNTTPSSE